MRFLALTGTLPNSIVENTAPWQWSGQLRLLTDPQEVRFLEVDGFAGNFFEASLDRMTGAISLAPLARLDAEWFRQAGRSLDIELGLRFFLTDGSVAVGSTAFTVRLQDLDDTPPQGLVFESGGSVRAGQAGATIGRLLVSDPDTTNGFQFRLLEGDDWQFEVVDGELRLKPGISLDLGDGPRRELIIEVSDGTQSAAFSLPIEILPDPATSTRPIDVLIPGMEKAGFGWAGGVGVRGFVPSWEIAEVERGGGMVRVETRRGEEVWFEQPQWVDFGDGFLDFRVDGVAARLWLIYDTLFDRRATLSEVRQGFANIQAGAQDVHIVGWLLNVSGEAQLLRGMSNRDFVNELYENILGRPPSTNVLNNQTQRIDLGILSREDLTMQLIDWRKRFDDYAAMLAEGFFTPRQNMAEIGTVLRVGANADFTGQAWQWDAAFKSGAWSLHGLSVAVLGTAAGMAKWGGVSNADFVSRMFLEARGVEFNAAGAAWWTGQLDTGGLTRGDFLHAVSHRVPGTSPFRETPLGGGFDFLW